MRLQMISALLLMLTTACHHTRGPRADDLNTNGFVLGGGMGDGSDDTAHGAWGSAGTAGSTPAPAEVIAALMADFQRVHFGYDAWTLDAASTQALARNAALLQTWGGLVVEVQGHSDARGSTEYNLALGQRRAAAVRDALIGMGVAPDRVASVSFGEEVPLDQGSGEVAWAENRRAEFRVLSGDGQVNGTVD